MDEQPTADQVRDIVAFAMDCARQGETDLLRRYVEGGFPVNHTDEAGNTALMLAAYHGHAATVAALIDLGADPDRLNERGQSPIAGALFKGEEDVVAVLRGAGADLEHGQPTARAAARMFGSEHLIDGAPS